MANPILREKLNKGEFIFAPGIQDMITASVANKVGFDVVYGSGYWSTASAYGLPDAGIVSVTQMVDRMATLVKTCNSAVIADADTGFGGLLNVHHTVRSYQEAGVSAIQIEDQEFPKKCGHTPNRKVIPLEDMVEKIKVAIDARTDPDMLIIARTDSRQAEGFDAAIARAQAYQEAGADVLFVEALESKDEMRRACALVNGPMMANMANGGCTPMMDAEEMKDIGFALAIAPALTSLAAIHAVEQALVGFKEQGSPVPEGVPIGDFKEFCSLIGFDEVWEFEKKWAK